LKQSNYISLIAEPELQFIAINRLMYQDSWLFGTSLESIAVMEESYKRW